MFDIIGWVLIVIAAVVIVASLFNVVDKGIEIVFRDRDRDDQ